MKPNLTSVIFNLLFPKVTYRKYNTNKIQNQNGSGHKMLPKHIVKNIIVNFCMKSAFAFLL